MIRMHNGTEHLMRFLVSTDYLELILVISSVIQFYVIFIFTKIFIWAKRAWPFLLIAVVCFNMLIVRMLRQAALERMLSEDAWLSLTTHFFMVDSLGMAVAGWAIYRRMTFETDSLLKTKALEVIEVAKEEAKVAVKEVIDDAAAKAKTMMTDAAVEAATIVTTTAVHVGESREAAAESRRAAEESHQAAEKSHDAAVESREAVETLKQVTEEKKNGG